MNYLYKGISPVKYGTMFCDSMINKYRPEELPPEGLFTYHHGVFLSGMLNIYKLCDGERYFNYTKAWVDCRVDENGTIHNNVTNYAWVSLDSLDYRQPGIIMFYLYEKTGDKRYEKVIKYLAESLVEYPKNSVGGFWHAKYTPHQMWLDGLYMAGPISVMYAHYYGKAEFYDIAAKQVIIMHEHMTDKKTGLMYHGWDESKTAPWADKNSGLSQEFWGRAIGWYTVAVMDILEYLPENHKDREKLIEIERNILASVINFQNKKTGRWYQVIDKGDRNDNWEENSCSCLFVYSIAKAVRLGVLKPDLIAYAKRGFEGVVDSLKFDGSHISLESICCGTNIEKGTYDYYISRPTQANDLHGGGAFLLMCAEMEKAEI